MSTAAAQAAPEACVRPPLSSSTQSDRLCLGLPAYGHFRCTAYLHTSCSCFACDAWAQTSVPRLQERLIPALRSPPAFMTALCASQTKRRLRRGAASGQLQRWGGPRDECMWRCPACWLESSLRVAVLQGVQDSCPPKPPNPHFPPSGGPRLDVCCAGGLQNNFVGTGMSYHDCTDSLAGCDGHFVARFSLQPCSHCVPTIAASSSQAESQHLSF